MFLCNASEGSAFIDRELYLPKDWADDAVRRQEAGIPEEVRSATRPDLAHVMLERAFSAQACAYVVGDTVYGNYPALRDFLGERRQPYVLAVPSSEMFWYGKHCTVKELAAEVKPGDWQRHLAGDGSKGPRFYDWARLQQWQTPSEEDTWSHYPLVRRSIDDPTDLAY